jgi:hypothetical protein
MYRQGTPLAYPTATHQEDDVATIELQFHSLQRPEGPSRGRYAHDGKPPRLLLSGGKQTKLREVPLDREQLLRIIEQAAVALRALDRDEAKA